MSKTDGNNDRLEHRKLWLARLLNEIQKIEPFYPFSKWPDIDGFPQWVQNVEREFSVSMMPSAKTLEWDMSPKTMGSVIGHMCAFAVWIETWFEELMRNPPQIGDTNGLPKIEDNQIEEFLVGFGKWYATMRRLAKLSLCSSVDLSYEDMLNFQRGFADGFARKPKSFGFSDVGTTATEIYQFMAMWWRFIETLKSVRELHELLVKCMGSHKIGDQKRIEKICQRVGLTFRKAGRPKAK